MRLSNAALLLVAAGSLACSNSTSNVVCESAVCGLGPTLFVRGTTTVGSVATANIPVEAAGFLGACGTSNLAEYTLVPPVTTSDSTGYYVFGIEPKRERLDVCLRLRAIHATDSIVVDTTGLNFIPPNLPPVQVETLTVNFAFP